MKAPRVLPDATSSVVQEIEDPALRPGSVIVRIEAVFASHFAAKIVDGSGGYLTPPRPFAPGMDAIGSVESIADGVTGLSIGDRVYCYYEPRHPARPGFRNATRWHARK